MASIMTAPIRPLAMATPTVRASTRLASIDALRGFVMLLMLLDHVRETFLLWVPVADPVDATTTDPAYFFTRLTSTLCAPVFVALTGLSAYLYSQRHSRNQTSAFLLKRGAFLILLELTLVNFVWRAQFPPTILYLQVIWAIGLSMIVLATLIHLPHKVVAAIGIGIAAGHNLLDSVTVAEGHPLHLAWSLLHDRAMVTIQGFPVRFSYPVLPWFGVIALGWTVGPWFASGDGATRRKRWCGPRAATRRFYPAARAQHLWRCPLVRGRRRAFAYGHERPGPDHIPPSLLFLMSTLGVGLLLLALFERVEAHGRSAGWRSSAVHRCSSTSFTSISCAACTCSALPFGAPIMARSSACPQCPGYGAVDRADRTALFSHALVRRAQAAAQGYRLAQIFLSGFQSGRGRPMRQQASAQWRQCGQLATSPWSFLCLPSDHIAKEGGR